MIIIEFGAPDPHGRNWTVGMRVVCIDASGDGGSLIVEGKVYVLSAVGFCACTGQVVVCLQGVAKPKSHGCSEGDFRASRFRPAEDKKTDIGVFKSLLNPTGPWSPAKPKEVEPA